MRYNTGNPVEPDGSSDPRDLFDNAGNIDLFANGSNPSYLDRKGVSRKSIRGMEQDFSDFLANSGFEPVHLVYVDGQPLTVSRPTQLIDRDGRTYRVKFPAAFPVTLTGTWATDLTKLVEIDDQALRQDLASAEGYDQIGATLPTGVVSTVKGFFNWILDRITLSTSGSASIVAAVAKGGKVVIKNGGHYINSPAICDYGVEPVVGFAGHDSKRYDITGETSGGTTLIPTHTDYTFILKGSFPVTQNFGGFDSIGNLTIANADYITTPNTTGAGGLGIFVQTKAYTNVNRYVAIGLRRGLHLDGVLTSTVEDVTMEGCYEGLIVEDTNETSGPNAMHFRRVKIGGTTSNGARCDVGAAMNFTNLTIEGCCVMGGSSVGMIMTNRPNQLAGAVNFEASYCELNAGAADYYLNNSSVYPLVINIGSGSIFARVSGARYTNTNIAVNSSGGGNVIVKLGATSFLSHFGYAPSADRPYFSVGSKCEVIWDESCVFSETTSLVYWLCLNRDYSFTVAANGNILSGPPGFAISSLGSGLYRLYRTAGRSEFAKFEDDVSVIVSPGVGGFAHYIAAKTTTTIDIQLHNGAAPANAKFDVTIRRIVGFYA